MTCQLNMFIANGQGLIINHLRWSQLLSFGNGLEISDFNEGNTRTITLSGILTPLANFQPNPIP